MHRRVIAALGAAAVTAGVLVAAPAGAAGSAPGAPVLVSPANGATAVPAGTQLRVTAGDPDDATLDVRFYGRVRPTGTANTAAPFTLVAIPDTQNYTSAAANRPIMGQQTQWIVNSRATLNTVFAVQLGDLVGIDSNTTQWQAASQYMATLDAAGVPNSVLPGNHDMSITTGDAPLYRQYFPVSRYATASWNGAAASYGGYLGQNQFGTDGADRQDLDNYALFTAGGMDFLLLNLEFNTPDYVIAWARRVLAAYPNRRAIVATHSYVDTTGAISSQVLRTDTADAPNSPQQLWQKLISPSCSIFMVINGHFYDGDRSEASRTDTNACGTPVLGLLSDYQGRANGGNGWLRYYTFRPADNAIQAVTYSPSLNQYETDADSAFTMPYDMRAGTQAPFAEIGRASVASGGTASVPAPAVPAGSTYEWYATVGDGTTVTTGPPWSFTAGAAAGTTLATDGFGRSVNPGWGTADTGGAWSVAGTASRYAVTGGQGVQTVPSAVTTTATLPGVSSSATDVAVSLSAASIPNGTVYARIGGRSVGSADLSGRVKINPNGSVELHVTRTGTVLAGGTLPGLTLAAGQVLRVRVQVQGTSPTSIRARAWPVGAAEPSTWQVSTTDATPQLQAAGAVQLSTYLSSSATNGPVAVRYDDLAVNRIA